MFAVCVYAFLWLLCPPIDSASIDKANAWWYAREQHDTSHLLQIRPLSSKEVEIAYTITHKSGTTTPLVGVVMVEGEAEWLENDDDVAMMAMTWTAVTGDSSVRLIVSVSDVNGEMDSVLSDQKRHGNVDLIELSSYMFGRYAVLEILDRNGTPQHRSPLLTLR